MENITPGDTELSQDNYMYLSLMLSIDGEPVSRASNPTPGQDGDGREPGVNDENHIYDVCVFIYDGGSQYANAADDTPIIASAYATEDQLIKRNTTSGPGYDGNYSRETLPIKIHRIPLTQTTQAIVVANMGNLLEMGINTLGALRDRIIDQSWNNDNNTELCTRFTMASSSFSYLSNINGGSKDNPIVFECNVERTMARIDFCWLNTPRFSAEGYDTYDVVSRLDATNKLGEVYVTNMRLFNVMQQPSYFLKRVARQVGEAVNYLGRETVSSQGIASNYVIDPRTASKTTANRTNTELLANWFGTTRMGLFTNEFIKEELATYPYTSKYLRNLDFRGETVKGFIMSYANENTLTATASCAEFCTGILFETIYKPAVVYNYDKETKTLTPNTGYTKGTTFSHYETIDNVMDESNNLCFMTEQEAIDYRNDHPIPADIKTYINGRSYYRMWIKHANDGNNEVNGPMEYGIVRNNIYRIAVKAFNGPGSIEPDIDRNPELINPYIFVKPWDVIVMPDVLM